MTRLTDLMQQIVPYPKQFTPLRHIWLFARYVTRVASLTNGGNVENLMI